MWWHTYGQALPGEPELWTTNREAARIYGLNYIRGEVGGGVSKEANSIMMGGNSGYQALGLALHFGAAVVILLGYDMQLTGGRAHWHANHAEIGNPREDRMRDWRRRFEELSHQTKVPIFNASRETALKCFPRVDLALTLT